MLIRLSGIHLYPVKSLAGLSVDSWMGGVHGLEYDRHWMLVDEKGEFVTQRRLPRMALIQTALRGDALVLSAPGMQELIVAKEYPGAPLEVLVWEDRVQALDAGVQVADWLSGFLGEPLRLVYFPPHARRPVDPDYAEMDDRTAFSDGFPYLLISEASLQELNGRLEQPLPMGRFRPNLVVSGTEPFAEDRWRRIRVGGLSFRVVKPCSRCIITTIDPLTARRGAEPLRTLSGYRRRGNKVFFGQNLIHDGIGGLSVGDQVEVLESA